MRLAITIMVITLVASLACTCLAGNNPLGKVAVHVRAHNAKLACSVGPISTCEDIVETYAGSSVDAFPVFYDLTEYKGFEYGINWPASFGSASFTSCSDQVIGAVVNPGNGASHAYFTCQAFAVGIPSFVWLYADAAGQVCVVNHPVGSVGPGIYVLDCAQALDSPAYNYCAGVLGTIGDDPCQDATDPTTWSAIKQIFR